MADWFVQADDWGLRRAVPEDNERLCALVRDVHVRGSLDVTQERDPDFFALGRMQGGTSCTWVFVDRDGSVEGSSTIGFRDAWVGGRRIKTGYCCDLRLTPKMRGGERLSRGWRAVLDWARDEMGTELFHDVIFDSNAMARGSLEKRGEKRPHTPVHTPICPYDMTSIQFTKKRVAAPPRVRRATGADFDEIVALLQRDQSARVLGYVVDGALIEQRFATWPGFSIESFLVLRDAHGKLLGCVAPYDTARFKRTRVLGYHGEMRAFRAGFDLAARVRGFRRLPEPGGCFDFSFLTHLAVDGDDPELLRELLLAAYAELAPRNQHFMSALVPRGAATSRAFRGFFVNRTPMTLYAVARPDTEWARRDLRTMRPGFEIALS